MNYIATCLVMLSGLLLVAPSAEARWIDVSGTTNDGDTLSFENNDPGRTKFTYRIITHDSVRIQEGVTSWCYRGKVKLNPNASPTTNSPGWYVYTKDNIVSVYANSPASFNLLKAVCSGT
jgi:hypothetical protein